MDQLYAQYLLQKTKEDYSLIAKDFSSKRKYPWPEIKFLFDKYLISGEKVLDLGCGNGRYFPWFEQAQVNYFGADISPELIEIAKNKYPKAKFYLEDALNLSFPNNFFDKIYSVAVLHHVPSRQFRNQFLKEARRTLKSGGLLIMTAWKFHQLKELRLLFKYTLLKAIGKSKLDWMDVFEPWGKKTKRYYHFFSKKELADLVEKSGFKIADSGVAKNEKGNRQNIYVVARKA